ncbi:outer membrane beta-barrel protein [Taibaiella soli]|uniref:Porin family protein n=1 Tax=Taibaiella soli TaxID=1649169 RepID=A0A2W2B3X2_9BACT|nr:outer membrane beta-barrel protein [Taibaiella soli]PZF75024.1 porin family protein [Taibaiella soli]
MKKHLLRLSVLCAVFNGVAAHAQTEKGNLLVGSDVSNFKLNFQKENTAFSMNISPKLGYFIEDNIAVGGYVNIDFSTSDGASDLGYGVGAFGRYYLKDKKVQVLKRSCFFAEANAGFAGRNISVKDGGKTNTNGLGIGFGPGWSYFVTPNIGLEALLKYNIAAGFGNATTSNSLDFNVGFQIYLPGKKMQKQLKSDITHP